MESIERICAAESHERPVVWKVVVTRLSTEHRDLPVDGWAPDAIVFCDVSTRRIVKANEAFSALLGRPPSDVIGRSFAELWGANDGHGDGVSEGPAQELASGIRGRVRHMDGSWIDVHMFAGEVEVDGRPTLVSVVHDVRSSLSPSPPARSDAHSFRAEERARELDKHQALGRLAGTIAHDFNNLLSIIVGCVDALERTLPEHGRPREIAGELASASERATALIRNLVAFSRHQTPQLRVINLNSVLQSMERMLGRLLGHSIHLMLELDPALPAVSADIAQIEQVVMSLCTNARDAMPSGGEIIVATSAVVVDSTDAAHKGCPQSGHWVALSVTDFGNGMDAEVLSHAFEPFFTTKNSSTGMGLGLTTVHGIVTQSAGYVSIDSEPGKGTVVHVWLPAVRVAAEAHLATGHDS